MDQISGKIGAIKTQAQNA